MSDPSHFPPVIQRRSRPNKAPPLAPVAAPGDAEGDKRPDWLFGGDVFTNFIDRLIDLEGPTSDGLSQVLVPRPRQGQGPGPGAVRSALILNVISDESVAKNETVFPSKFGLLSFTGTMQSSS